MRLREWTDHVLANAHDPIEKFCFGKAIVRSRIGLRFDYQDTSTWLHDDLTDRLGKEYDGLIILCAVIQEMIPLTSRKQKVDCHVLDNHEDYAISLKQMLIAYYAYEIQDPRLGNESFGEGKKTTEKAAASVVYLAFKLNKTADDNRRRRRMCNTNHL